MRNRCPGADDGTSDGIHCFVICVKLRAPCCDWPRRITTWHCHCKKWYLMGGICEQYGRTFNATKN